MLGWSSNVDPDPHSEYGSGSRYLDYFFGKLKSVPGFRKTLDPDPHWEKSVSGSALRKRLDPVQDPHWMHASRTHITGLKGSFTSITWHPLTRTHTVYCLFWTIMSCSGCVKNALTNMNYFSFILLATLNVKSYSIYTAILRISFISCYLPNFGFNGVQNEFWKNT